MKPEPMEDENLPSEIDFSKGSRGLHYVPGTSRILMPAAIEKSVWEYFSGKAEEQGIELSELLTEVLRRGHGNQRGAQIDLVIRFTPRLRSAGRPVPSCLPSAWPAG